MDALGKASRWFFVAAGAVDRLGGDVVVGVGRLEVGVAANAGVGGVNRRAELGRVHEQGDFFARLFLFSEVLVAVALQALFVALFLSARRPENQPRRGRQSRSPTLA